ncbi:hypothetical protein H0H87_009224 [Tephrocybe sp. NHM501043]|nr:hypothetical protein H0H87_009224 [Tephrocybe sp. NHM501043]
MLKKSLALTLLVYTVLANAHNNIPRQHDANLKRIIKKRAPLPQLFSFTPVAGAGAAVPTFTSTTSSPASSSATSDSQSSTSLSTSSSASDLLSAASVSTISSTSASLSDSSSTSVSSTSSSASTSSKSTSSIPTSSAVVTPTPDQPAVTTAPTTTQSKSIVTLTSSVDASQSATSIPQQAANAAKPKSTTITVLIAVASAVAALAILWTVFRKWKFGRSTKFDERLQPIDWRPTNDDDEPLPGHHRRHSGASSFRSAGHASSAHGHGSSDVGHNSPSSYALPEHDFTAGPAHLAPLGGYADLARGPSPRPQMNQTGGNAMLSHPAYDVGVPLHH